MFENSLIGRLPLRCPQHPQKPITHLCTDSLCDGTHLFCQLCRNTYRYKEQHYGHELRVSDLATGVGEICSRLERDRKVTGSIFGSMSGVKGVEGLLKWQEEKEQHFNAIENHIKTIKFQVEQELARIVEKFQEELQVEKNRLYSELEHYFVAYKDKFEQFSRLTEPIVSMHNKYQFYSTPHTLFLKLQHSHDPNHWLNQLIRTLKLTEMASDAPEEYSQEIRRHGEAANQIMDQLPRIRSMDFENELPLIMSKTVREILHSLVKLKEVKTAPHIVRTTSMQAMNHEQRWKQSGYQ